jgi:hypothetical protein
MYELVSYGGVGKEDVRLEANLSFKKTSKLSLISA